ncbi:MAG TPA: DNA-processing protein DprA [Candidatus Saccharimonadales bacterium]|nr:DNA-processing protein DprA [Candidatus Saccharimonadales bacterium]
MLTLTPDDFPEFLSNIPAPPQILYYEGPLRELLDKPRLAVVGSRKVSPYGRRVTAELAGAAAGQGIVIVSGLALGVDSLAHEAALEAGGLTIAVLPSSLQQIYPASHRNLAKRILESGGALVTEYIDTPRVQNAYFIARNRLISGLSQATLVTEAALKSGSLHTARFTLEQGRELLAVPGSIYSETSEGANNLIKAGAVPVTTVDDILFAMKLERPAMPHRRAVKGANDAEQAILDQLAAGINDGEDLQAKSNLDTVLFSQTLTMLEITGKIRSTGANHWSLA